MMPSWGLEVGWKEDVEWVLKGCVESDWIYGLKSVLERASAGVGFLLVEETKGIDATPS